MVLAIYVYWQAVKDASTSFAYCFPEEGNYEATVDEDNGVLLRDISGCFDKQYSKGNQVPISFGTCFDVRLLIFAFSFCITDEFDNLEFDNLKPDIVSNKVISMVKLLRRFRSVVSYEHVF